MKNLVTAAVVLLALSGAAQPESAAAPGWFLNDIAVLAAGTGRWVTDNSAYMSDVEPHDTYGTEWTASFDGTTMSGRLFAVEDGVESTMFWEFRQYWHPGRGEGVLEQFGRGGKIVIGKMSNDGHDTTIEQTSYTMDGGTRRSGHISRFLDADTYFTESFNVKGDTWTPHRKYTWRRIVTDQQ